MKSMVVNGRRVFLDNTEVSLEVVCKILDRLPFEKVSGDMGKLGLAENFVEEYIEEVGRNNYMHGRYGDGYTPWYEEYPEDNPYDEDCKSIQMWQDFNEIKKMDEERRRELNRWRYFINNPNIYNSTGMLAMDALEDENGYGASYCACADGSAHGDHEKFWAYAKKWRDREKK